MNPVCNVMTVDVEEWYEYYGDWLQRQQDVSAYAAWRKRARHLTSSVVQDTEMILRFFDEVDCRATFFVLGSIARRWPSLVRTIQSAGHEIGIHGDEHTLFYMMSREQRRESIERALEAVWDAASVRSISFRAPCFSLNRTCLDIFATLANMGIRYDSSIFPVRHSSYGLPNAPRGVYSIEDYFKVDLSHDIIEFAPATWRTMGYQIPIGSSTYMRFLPQQAIVAGIRQLNLAGEAATLVFHTWEANLSESPLPTSLSMKARHQFRRRHALTVLRSLSTQFKWDCLRTVDESNTGSNWNGKPAGLVEHVT